MKTTICLAIAIVVLAVVTPLAHAADATRAWNNQFNGPGRFTVLNEFNQEAVFDKETGLVWERSPDTSTWTWDAAHSNCNYLNLGNRYGWRLPTLQELASLVDGDPANISNPRLPPGHPFQNVQGFHYWSATTVGFFPSFAWVVAIFGGGMAIDSKANHQWVWCVRGGQGVDPQ